MPPKRVATKAFHCATAGCSYSSDSAENDPCPAHSQMRVFRQTEECGCGIWYRGAPDAPVEPSFSDDDLHVQRCARHGGSEQIGK